MESLTSLFQTTGAEGAASAGAGDTVVSAEDFGTEGALPGKSGSGGFGIDRLFGSSQGIPFVGPIVSVFQAFQDEKNARRAAARIDFNARQEELVGKAQTVSALRTLNDIQAMNVVAAFTSGGGLAGSRGRVIQDVSRDAELAFTLIRTNAEIKASDLKQQARFMRKTARFERNVAVGKSLFRFGASAVGAAS